jgi:hypothetical protein
MLMLDWSEAAKLTSAAKKGQLRILVRRETEKVESVFDLATTPAEPPVLPIVLPVEFPLPEEIVMPLVSEASLAIPSETALVAAPAPPAPPTADNYGAMLPSVPMPPQPESPNEERVAIRNEISTQSFGQSQLRNISDRPAEHQPALIRLASPSDEPGQKALERPYTEFVATPRTTQTIQFLPPSKTLPVREYPKETVSRIEAAVIAPSLQVPLVTPPVLSAPIFVPERVQVPVQVQGYTPFERRIYVAQPQENWDMSSGDELLPPSLL